MKRFRNNLKGPLPIELLSGSISVPSKGFFLVSDDDVQSPDLISKVNKKQVEPEKENVITTDVPTIEDSGLLEGNVITTDSTTVEDSELFKESVDVIIDEKGNDSLTTSSEMVELEVNDSDSGDAVGFNGYNVSRKKKRFKK